MDLTLPIREFGSITEALSKAVGPMTKSRGDRECAQPLAQVWVLKLFRAGWWNPANELRSLAPLRGRPHDCRYCEKDAGPAEKDAGQAKDVREVQGRSP
jgi:hypothetical protein